MSQEPLPPDQTPAQYVDSAARLLGLPIDSAYRSSVIENMETLMAIAQSVLAFPITADLEAASSFDPLPPHLESHNEL
jgi:hypothetical protein